MTLTELTPNHLVELMSWFDSQQQITDWAGPDFSYPFDQDSFVRDLELGINQSFVLLASDSTMVAFGQYSQKLDKCHLARLVVKPCARGKGIVGQLVTLLSTAGLTALAVIYPCHLKMQVSELG